MTHSEDFKNAEAMRKAALGITKALADQDADLQTAAAALAMVLCNVGKECGLQQEELIQAFTNSVHMTYALKEETLQ